MSIGIYNKCKNLIVERIPEKPYYNLYSVYMCKEQLQDGQKVKFIPRLIGNEVFADKIKPCNKYDKKNGSQFLTVSEVSDILYIHSNTVRRWSDIGILPVYRMGPRGDRRFRREDVEYLLTKI